MICGKGSGVTREYLQNTLSNKEGCNLICALFASGLICKFDFYV